MDSFAAITATDASLAQYPIAMMGEPGCWDPTEDESLGHHWRFKEDVTQGNTMSAKAAQLGVNILAYALSH